METTTNNVQGAVNVSTPATKMLAIGRWTEKGLNIADRLKVMPKEVQETVKLYLTGAIEQWYVKPDMSGVVFIMNSTSAEQAHTLLEDLPLGIAQMMVFDLIPLGPITPLRFLLPQE